MPSDGDFEIEIPERDSPYWIGAYVDVDQDGKPGANDPSAWYSGNPIMGNRDNSGVVLELSVSGRQSSVNNTAIVIPTLGNPLNKAWIESVVSTIKVIVVCDGDDDLVIEGVTQIFSNRQGFSGAANMGIRQAQQDGYQSVLVLNDDAIPEQDALKVLFLNMCRKWVY